jgi:hypothetical protein
MEHRWGSCTPANRTIRISSRLKQMPEWVLDYVLVHELAHLLVAAHDASFWALVDRYERTERARGYLEGYATASRMEMTEDDSDDTDTDTEVESDLGPGADAEVVESDVESGTDRPRYRASGSSSPESEPASVGGSAVAAAAEPGALF